MQRPWGGLRGGRLDVSGQQRGGHGLEGRGRRGGAVRGGVKRKMLQAVPGKVERIRILFFLRWKTTTAVLSNTVATCGCLFMFKFNLNKIKNPVPQLHCPHFKSSGLYVAGGHRAGQCREQTCPLLQKFLADSTARRAESQGVP